MTRIHSIRSIGFIVLILLCALPGCKKDIPTVETDDLTRPVIWVSAFDLSFSASIQGEDPDPQILQIKNSGASTIEYTISDDAEWLSVSETAGSSSGQVIEHTVRIDKSELAASTDPYSATITVSCNQAYNNPQRVSVQLEVTDIPVKPPKIQLTPTRLSFTAQKDGAAPSPQKITIGNSGGGSLNFQAVPDSEWISVSPSSGRLQTNEKNLKVSVDPSGLAPGTYKGAVQITDSEASNSPREAVITLKISDTPLPRIRVSTSRLTFESVVNGPPPSSQYLFVGNSGGGTLKYSLESDAAWLSVSPAGGQSGGEDKRHSVTVNPLGLSSGSHVAALRVCDPAALGGDQIVRVFLNISAPLTDNKIGLAVSPDNGPTGTMVTVSINVRGNTSSIEVFGLEVHFNPEIFSYQSTTTGTLTSNWAAVGGNEISSGTIKIGGFHGSGNPIAAGGNGTIAVLTLKVTGGSAAGGTQSQISINNFSDDIIGMIPSPASLSFTYVK